MAPCILTRSLDGGERSDSRLGSFTPGETVTGNRYIGGWVGPRTGMGQVEKRKKS
jgi:hypothetical protein